MPYTPDLDKLLILGSRYSDEHAVYLIEPHDVAEVTLPTGQVVGCDPLAGADDAEPFLVSVPAGVYALRAWVAVLHKDGAEWQRRVAALQLVIRDEPAARWVPALLAGQDPSALGSGSFFGYAVDAGTGTLADTAAVRALAAWDHDRIEEVYIRARYPLAPIPGGVISAVTDERTGANVVAVSSGWGDGNYPTFIGYTAEGDVGSFVTDFLVIPGS
jgi:hypothetical protein